MDKTAITVATYDKVAVNYARKFMDLSLYRETVEYFGDRIDPKGRVLDLACGPGNIAQFLLNRSPELKWTGLDLSTEMIKIARAALPQAEFLVRDIRTPGYPAFFFEAVVASFALPYLDDREALDFIATIGRIVKPDGLIYLSCMEGKESRYETASFSAGNLIYLNYFSEVFLREAFATNGLEIVKLFKQDYPEPDGSVTLDLVFILRKKTIVEDVAVDYLVFTAADCRETLEFWSVVPGLKLWPEGEDSPEAIKHFINRNPGLSFIARQNGRIVGALLCGHDGRRGSIYHLAVAPQARFRGIGKQLLELSLEQLRQSGIRKCRLFVLEGNRTAELFYHKLGWQAESAARPYAKSLF